MADRATRWTVQPLVERPGRVLLALAAIAAISVATALFAQDAGWGLIAAMVLGIALNRVILPSRYAIELGALVVDHPLRRRSIEWSKLERIAFDERGALLSGAGFRQSIDLPSDPAQSARVAELLRLHAVEGCAVVDRRIAQSARGASPTEASAAAAATSATAADGARTARVASASSATAPNEHSSRAPAPEGENP